ncbi:zinc-dependent alcohol dehydrogenase [Candidatus Formimonas warabiya]|uniref:Enoyl reductase (ER) domain-containing protein n=1 Tax=Formimonas warabiya TaxID=1761012 RepID=A0A3G1KTU2_FORW1|nr:alcohol dehydrogenase catalytic domain-containing protein [Candidatus Formimonas warabiya]ATW25882.1 hypothetical protein DCMF_14870 [Candidatus Formimonas warabiya]
MKVALLTEPLKFNLVEEEKPEPGPDQVRIRVASAGICGTDIEAFLGNVPRGWHISYPFRMGHELAGTVDQVGAHVTTVRVGDRVVPDGRLTCGHCYQCRRRKFSACLNAGYISGGFMEYTVYPSRNLVRLPDGLSWDQGAWAEPVSCCIYGNSKLEVGIGDTAVVFGDGPIGIIHGQLLKKRGARTILVGVADHKLKIAEQTGIDETIHAQRRDPVAEVRRLTGGRGADIVVVAVGHEKVLEQALYLAGRGGQILYFAAALKEKLALPLDLVHYQELKLMGSYDSMICHYEDALQAMASGAVVVEPLISHRFALEDIQKAFELARKREGLKILIQNRHVL